MPRTRKGGGVKTTWRDKELERQLERRLARNMERTGAYLHKAIAETISKGQPVRRTRSGKLVGTTRARAGAPPRVLHGHLRNTLFYEVKRRRGHLSLKVGARTKYARALELGGHPFLRPALRRHRAAIKRMMTA